MRLFLLLTSFCLLFTEQSALAQPINILTSIRPLALIASDIAGDDAQVEYLVPNEGSIHHYSMRVSDRVKVDNADLFIMIGAGLEPFSEKITGITSHRLVMAELPAIETLEGGEHDDHAHSGSIDPHLWLSPKNATLMALAIKHWLIENYPRNSDRYEANYQDFIARQGEALIPLSDSTQWHYYTYHNAFEYLFKSLNLHVEASLTTSNEAGVGMRSLYDLKQRLAKQTNYCVLASKNVAQKTRKQLGVEVVHIDMLASYGEYNHYSDYLKSMLKTIQTCQ